MARTTKVKSALITQLRNVSDPEAEELKNIIANANKQERKQAMAERLKRSRWMPGQSGNPKGRKPIALTLANIIREVGEELVQENPDVNRVEALVRALYHRAEMGSDTAASLLLERGFGKVPTLQINVGYELIRKAQSMGIKPEDVTASVELTEVFQASGVNIIDNQFILTDKDGD